MRMSRGGVFAASMVGLALVPVAAHVPTGLPLIDSIRRNRAASGSSLDSLDLRGHMRPAIGVVGDWAYRPLVENAPNGDVQYSIVRNQIVSTRPPRSSCGIGSGWGSTCPSRPSSTTARAPREPWRLPRRRTRRRSAISASGSTCASSASTAAPSRARSARTCFSPRATPRRTRATATSGSRPICSSRATPDRSRMQRRSAPPCAGSTRRSPTSTSAAPSTSAWLLGLRVADRRLVIGPEVFGSSVVADGAFLTKQATPLEGLFGAHYTFVGGVRLGAGISTGLTQGFGTPERRGLLSLEWAPEVVADRDGDGVADDVDACPDVPGVGNEDPTMNGCPPPPAPAPAPPPPVADRDGDGVPDAVDACPDVPGVATDDPKTNGCPSDRDHDGVLDGVDACPDVPGLADVGPEDERLPRSGPRQGRHPERDGRLPRPARKAQPGPQEERLSRRVRRRGQEDHPDPGPGEVRHGELEDRRKRERRGPRRGGGDPRESPRDHDGEHRGAHRRSGRRRE